jgi:hypothetical protein
MDELEDLSYPLTVDTIGKLIALGNCASGWCPTCQGFSPLEPRGISLYLPVVDI